ncbi:MAG: hypothetical protein WCD39_07095, partial [Methyloceanibacter sp.]
PSGVFSFDSIRITLALAKYSCLSIGGPTLVRILDSIGNQDFRMTASPEKSRACKKSNEVHGLSR